MPISEDNQCGDISNAKRRRTNFSQNDGSVVDTEALPAQSAEPEFRTPPPVSSQELCVVTLATRVSKCCACLQPVRRQQPSFIFQQTHHQALSSVHIECIPDLVFLLRLQLLNDDPWE